jgi:cytochrome c-type biogenesis protein CcmH/NrfG
MIIWIRERRGWVAAVFVVLAAIFAASFIIGGVGTGSNASLSDIIGNNDGSGASTTSTASIGSLEKKVKAKPSDAQSWQLLADAYAGASRPADEARAWGHVVKLKPSNMDSLQRLALAEAQVATIQTNQAQQLQQRALTSSPGNDSTFSGGTLGSLSEDPVTQAQAASESEQQGKLLTQASTYAKKANTWWKRSTGTYGKIVKLPAFVKNDLAATVWLNYGSAAQNANDTKTAITAYNAFLKLAPDDVNAPQVRTLVKQLKKPASSSSTTVTTTP